MLFSHNDLFGWETQTALDLQTGNTVSERVVRKTFLQFTSLLLTVMVRESSLRIGHFVKRCNEARRGDILLQLCP